MSKLILASQSPRRKELMTLAGYTFTTFNPDIEESFHASMDVRKVPEFLAKKKAEAALRQIKDKEAVIVTADTIVLLNGTVYGKPIDESDALRMLKELNGKMHEVITGVCIISSNSPLKGSEPFRGLEKEVSFSDTTKVFFKKLTDEQLNYYINHYKPLDKAGAYGIQDWMGVRGVEKIEGDYFNVMGLPVNRVAEALEGFGIK
jgi:septum formation protein